jgi:serine/threonine protein kinase
MLNIGDILENYRIVRLLSRRETGFLYQAVERGRGRPSGIQLFPWPFSSDERVIRRLWKEIAPIHKLDHPNIGWVYRVCNAADQMFLVTDLLDGSPLDYVIGGKPLAGDLVLSYAFQIASALEAAHGRGVLHLGLNPANIFVTSLGLKLLDFGLAAPMAAVFPDRSEEIMLAFAGSSASFCTHLSPEQAAGVPIDARSDLFSFGAVLYEMATGVPAFSSSKPNQTVERLLQNSPASPRSINPEISPALDAIILKAVEKERDQRYQTVSQVIQDLRAVIKVERLIALRQFTPAEHLLLGQLAADPQDTKAEKELADVQEQLSRVRRSNHIRHLCWQAEEEVISKRYAEAIETYKRAVMVDPLAHVLGKTGNSQSQEDQQRARTIDEIRAKIERLLALVNTQDFPAWIDGAGTWSPAGDEPQQPSPLNPGDMLQNYRIMRILNLTAESNLYEAQDVRTERRVAIEFLHSLGDRQSNTIMLQEIEVITRLDHPNFCKILEVGEHDGVPYIVMEYLEGGNSLETVMSAGEMLPMRVKLGIMRQVCAGLEYAHRNGFPYLDINPSKVILQRSGQVKLVRYWSTRGKDGAGFGVRGNRIAWIKYRSPEQLKGEGSDTYADAWSVGVILYRLFSHRHPFSGSDETEIVSNILSQPFRPLASELTEYPTDLDRVLGRALAKDPQHRYPSCGAMARDLQSVIAGLGSEYSKHPMARAEQRYSEVAETDTDETIGHPRPIPTSDEPSMALPPSAPLLSERAESSDGSIGSFTRLHSLEPHSAPLPQRQASPASPATSAGSAVGAPEFESLSTPNDPMSSAAKAPRCTPPQATPATAHPSPPAVRSAQIFTRSAENAPPTASEPSEFTRILDASRMRDWAGRGGQADTEGALPAPPPPTSGSLSAPPSIPSSPVLVFSPVSTAPTTSSELLDRSLDLALASSVEVLTPVEILALLRLPTSKSLSRTRSGSVIGRAPVLLRRAYAGHAGWSPSRRGVAERSA